FPRPADTAGHASSGTRRFDHSISEPYVRLYLTKTMFVTAASVSHSLTYGYQYGYHATDDLKTTRP
ncbi:MAG: hypothetical protein NTZ09_21990, partial [Candidatus Hydrogenedentes bacterium]|nr:hypothetical protein [Candidatus Hydrogenedentota bacterium]